MHNKKKKLQMLILTSTYSINNKIQLLWA